MPPGLPLWYGTTPYLTRRRLIIPDPVMPDPDPLPGSAPAELARTIPATPARPATPAERQAQLAPELLEILEDRVGHVGRGDISRLVESWLARRKKSMRAYQGSVAAFAGWLGSTRQRTLSGTDALQILFACAPAQANDLVEQWIENLSEDHAPGTVKARLSAIRSLVKFARKAGNIDWQLDVDAPESESYRDMAGPDPEAIECLINMLAAKRDTAAGARDWCLLALLLLQALRRFEIAACRVQSVELAHRRIWVLGKKRNEPETVDLEDATIEALQTWFTFHDDPRPDAPLVHAIGNRRAASGGLTADGIHAIFQKYAEEVSEQLGRPILFRPHGFRHASITQLVIAGLHTEVIRRFARHKTVATTQRYIDRIPEPLRKCAAVVADAYRMNRKPLPKNEGETNPPPPPPPVAG